MLLFLRRQGNVSQGWRFEAAHVLLVAGQLEEPSVGDWIGTLSIEVVEAVVVERDLVEELEHH